MASDLDALNLELRVGKYVEEPFCLVLPINDGVPCQKHEGKENEVVRAHPRMDLGRRWHE